MIKSPPLSRIRGAASFMPIIGPVRLTASARFQLPSEVSSSVVRGTMPALLTSTCRPPNVSRAAAIAVCQPALPATL